MRATAARHLIATRQLTFISGVSRGPAVLCSRAPRPASPSHQLNHLRNPTRSPIPFASPRHCRWAHTDTELKDPSAVYAKTAGAAHSNPTPDGVGPDGRETRTLLIVYHSLTDGARQMAQAAYEAALEVAAEEGEKDDAGGEPPRINVRYMTARDAGPVDVLAASAYLFVCPENLAAMAGIMKDFFDRSYYNVLGKANGRPYGVMICAGSDGEGAMRQLDRICRGWRLKKVADGIIIITHAQTAERCLAKKTIPEEELVQCRELGGAMVEGLRLGVW